jgi:malate synthase
MEDAATAEISRTQVWQWLHYHKRLADGREITASLVRDTIREQVEKIRAQVGEARYNSGKYPQAAALFEQMMLSPDLKDFLTLEAYRFLD